MPEQEPQVHEPRDAGVPEDPADALRDADAQANTETVSDDADAGYVRKLERENAKRVKDVAALKQQLDELHSQTADAHRSLAEVLGIDAGEVDPATLVATVQQVSHERDALRSQLRHERLTRAVSQTARAAGVWDVELALGALDLDAIEVAEDGTVSDESVQAAVATLKERKPRLFDTLAHEQPKPPLGSRKPAQSADAAATFNRSQLSDPDFYRANRAKILAAAARGSIQER